MGQIKVSIDDIYTNLLLIAISRKYDFSKLVKEADEETSTYIVECKDRFLPEGFVGLYYIELLSRKMGSSLGEVYNLSEVRKEEIIQNIIESFDPIREGYASYYNEKEDGIIEFGGLLCVLDVTRENEFILYFQNLTKPEISTNHIVYTYYNIKFRKEPKVEGDKSEILYSITIAGSQDFSSDYVYDSYKVWSGKDGPFAEYIEMVIKEYKNTHIEKKQGEDGDDIIEVEIDEDGKTDKSHFVEIEKPVIESEPIKDGPMIIDELVTYIWDNTKTVDVLDKFEGYRQSDSTKYKRIVIRNAKYIRYSNKHNPGFNLVIERGHGSDYVGNITFTQFKKGEASELAQYVNNEVTDEIIEQYIDRNQFYRFSKPFLLRAQNSLNRTGYGWEWDWSDGYGNYTEGTLYGETTNYFFVGAYITTGFFYEPSKRKPFVEKAKNIIQEKKLHPVKTGEKIVFYEGKLNNNTQNSVVQRFFEVETSKGSKYIPVSYDESMGIYYIAAANSKKYKQVIESGEYIVKKRLSSEIYGN